MPIKRQEQTLHKMLSAWLKIQYPTIYFMSDASGLPMSSWGLRNLLKVTRSRHAALDIVILEPTKESHGLILELKKDSPFKQTGELKTDAHYQDQLKSMEHLRSKGFQCEWVWSLEQGQKIINQYLKPKA